MIPTLLVFSVCFAFWLALSGSAAPLHLIFGAVSSAAVAWVNRDLEMVSVAARISPRFLAYLPWLLREIAVANIQVVRLVLHPRLPVDPVVVRFETTLRGDLARTTFANSITLTPGTVTLDVEGSEFVVHAVTRGMADLAGGMMERRIAAVFEEPRR
ncbi:MAG: Na+/H+ antiporter subunit E [Candidatus Rokubacteria bacterium]|nr:Na+/H+ antiporter subunit E [Candidatus Rokubacteria bacterium]